VLLCKELGIYQKRPSLHVLTKQKDQICFTLSQNQLDCRIYQQYIEDYLDQANRQGATNNNNVQPKLPLFQSCLSKRVPKGA